MAAPLAIAAIALAAGSAIGQYATGKTQAAMQSNYYNFLADQAKLKSDLARQAGEQQATYAQDEGAKLGHQLKKQVDQVEAAQTTGMIAQGIELGSVTAEDIANDTLNKYKLDEMAIRYNADLKAYEAKRAAIIQSWELYGEAASMGLSGQMMSSATRLQAQSSLIGGAAQTANNAYLLFGKGGTTDNPKTTK